MRRVPRRATPPPSFCSHAPPPPRARRPPSCGRRRDMGVPVSGLGSAPEVPIGRRFRGRRDDTARGDRRGGGGEREAQQEPQGHGGPHIGLRRACFPATVHLRRAAARPAASVTPGSPTAGSVHALDPPPRRPVLQVGRRHLHPGVGEGPAHQLLHQHDGNRLRRRPEPPEDTREELAQAFHRAYPSSLKGADGKGRPLWLHYRSGREFWVDEDKTTSARTVFGWLSNCDGDRIGRVAPDAVSFRRGLSLGHGRVDPGVLQRRPSPHRRLALPGQNPRIR